MLYDIIVIGGGPAGLTAAVYARRAGKSVLIIEKNTFGGQITWSPRVENFPGFVSVSGAELGDLMTNQAMEQGADVELEEVTAIRDDGDHKTVLCASGAQFEARAVILAEAGVCDNRAVYADVEETELAAGAVGEAVVEGERLRVGAEGEADAGRREGLAVEVLDAGVAVGLRLPRQEAVEGPLAVGVDGLDTAAREIARRKLKCCAK